MSGKAFAWANLGRLTEQLAEPTNQMRSEQKLLLSLAKNQTDLQPTMAELAHQVTTNLTGHEEMREFHPLDAANTAAAYARNRRIEIKLTQP